MDLARFLIERGADINAVNKSGNSALHDLCRNYDGHRSNQDEIMGLISYFLEKGAKINEENEDGETISDILGERGVYISNK